MSRHAQERCYEKLLDPHRVFHCFMPGVLRPYNHAVIAGSKSKTDQDDRLAGCLVGLAVGDALGAPLEFMPRDQVRKRYPKGLREMIASSQWNKGEYTDDTQMALMIAESLLQNKAFVASDVAKRFQAWVRSAKDVGIQTRAVVDAHGYAQDPEACSLRYHASYPDSSAGNGALMRCAPVALFCLHSLDELADMSRSSARVTHHDPKAQSSCVILNAWIRAAICEDVRDGRVKALTLLKDIELPSWHRLERIESLPEQEIFSTGYTVHTLEAAVWSFLTTESYEDAVIRAANLGDDADTVAAVCGALAGAYYGYDAIPERWRSQLQDETRIHAIALALGRVFG
jgi:ADP-ribosyl-[dinitrogen reductase] hydrolase